MSTHIYDVNPSIVSTKVWEFGSDQFLKNSEILAENDCLSASADDLAKWIDVDAFVPWKLDCI